MGTFRTYCRAIALFVGLLALWVVIGGIVPYQIARHLNKEMLPGAGQFGDMFGTVGAFFSGVALLAVVYTIYLQQKDIEESGKSQAEQMKLQTDHIATIAKSARIQTLTFLAQLQAEWIKEAPQHHQSTLRQATNYYVDKAMALMKELGQDFNDVPDGISAAGVTLFLRTERASSELFHIALDLQTKLAALNKDTTVDGNTRPSQYFETACLALHRWIANYHKDFEAHDVDALRKQDTALTQGTQNLYSCQPNSPLEKENYDKWWEWATSTAATFADIAMMISIKQIS